MRSVKLVMSIGVTRGEASNLSTLDAGFKYIHFHIHVIMMFSICHIHSNTVLTGRGTKSYFISSLASIQMCCS